MWDTSPPAQYESLDDLIVELSQDPDREPIASEIGVLQSIYDEESIKLWHPPSRENTPPEGRVDSPKNGGEPGTIRFEVTLSLLSPSDPDTTHPLLVLVSLPPAYPTSVPPQLQLLSRYVGPYGVDAALFGAVLRTYISRDGVEWTPGGVCVFDGLEWVRERCTQWLGERMSATLAGEIEREDERIVERPSKGKEVVRTLSSEDNDENRVEIQMKELEGIEIVEAEPIVDRKSSFIGRACRITDPAQVPIVLAYIMSDRRIARAAHPIINAWRCRSGNILHQDNDDDGETAAGGRLAHLLQILEVENVLVIVTRYWGGIHLGPDRFKHINQAARNALEIGGFLDVTGAESGRKQGRGKGSRK